MQIVIPYGRRRLEIEVPEQRLIGVSRSPQVPALPDPVAAVRQALETPIGFPALRLALTPDDHVAILIDERLPHLPALLTVVLKHIAEAHVRPEAITLLCPPPASAQAWVDDLPEEFQDVRIEVHDPGERKRLSYLATTRHGRRIYLNRTAVDADQLVILTRLGYDAILGYGGGEGALYPALSDEATRQEAQTHLSMRVPGEKPWPLRQEATEVAWLLGAPFLVRIIEGEDSTLAHVLAGPPQSSGEGPRLLDARWRVQVDRPADVVVASMIGDPVRHDFAEIARALACAARVVRRNGHIVLLTESEPALGEAAALLRGVDDAEKALARILQQKEGDREPAFQWANAAEQAQVFLLSNLPADVAEELFVTPLEHAAQAQRLVSGAGSCVFLPDAHKTMAVLRP
jgi:nickel-dependent lactate racemase